MDNAAFLEAFGMNATLRVKTPNGESLDLPVNLEILMETCPVFALEFEECGPFQVMKNTIEASSATVIICFLRFIYLDNYVANEAEPKPGLLLVHAELCRMAQLYDLPLLHRQASMNLALDLELSCCFPQPPVDLCQTIRYVYENLASQSELIDSILHYVVSCFAYHHLNDNEEFRKLFSEHHQFNKDLSRMNMERGFQDPGATDIIRLPADHPKRHLDTIDQYLMRSDYPYEMWGHDNLGESAAEDSSMSDADAPLWQHHRRMAYRPRHPIDIKKERERRLKRMMEDRAAAADDDSSASASEAEGFTLVRRPKVSNPSQSSLAALFGASSQSDATGGNLTVEGVPSTPIPANYGMSIADDPFADAEGPSSSDDDEVDLGMSSSVETLKPEEESSAPEQLNAVPASNSASASASIPAANPSGDQQPNPFSEDELIEYDSWSDSDWSEV